MKPIVFLGQTFTDEASFKREFPAYFGFISTIRAGADTPHKVEVAVHRRQTPSKHGKQRAKA